jgi:hypothetical protein
MAKILRKTTESNVVSFNYVSSMEEQAREYNELRKQKSIIEKKMKELSDNLKNLAEQYGTQDNNGSYYLSSEKFQVGKQAKKSISFNEPVAIAYLKGRKLADAIYSVEKVNEDVVESYVSDGTIPISDLEGITNTKVSYAVIVKEVEEMPDVQVTGVANAASKKTRGR